MAIAGVLSGIATWAFKPETTVPLTLVLPTALAGIVVIATMFRTAQRLHADQLISVPTLPRVLTALGDYGDGTGRPVLLLEASPFFGAQTPVSIYQLNHGGFEVMVGIGLVATVQTNGLLPVRIEQWSDRFPALLDSLIHNDADALKQIAVRPSVPLNSPFSMPGSRDYVDD
jgi:hypothetical protein